MCCTTAGSRATQVVRQEQQSQLIAKQLIRADEALLNLRNVETGKTVIAHGGSVYWNNYRKRWVMIAVESYGSSSLLGEIWFAEADTPLGPWTYAQDREPRPVQLLQSQAASDVRQGWWAGDFLRGDVHDDVLGKSRSDAAV